MIKLAFDGIIGEGDNTASFVRNALARGGDVEARINSPGGDAFEGLAIYNLLAGHSGRVRVIIDSIAASAASLIAMAGDPIIMLQGSTLMLHEPAGVAVGSADDMQKSADVLDTVAQQFAEIYAKRTGKSVEDIRALMKEETWMDSEAAVEAGFATVASVKATTALVAPFDPTKLNINHLPERVAAMAKGTAMPEITKPEDVTARILSRAAAAKLSAVDTAKIVADAGGDEAKATDAIIDMLAKAQPSPRITVGGDAGGDEEGFNKAIREQLTAKLVSKPGTGTFAGMRVAGLAGEFLRAHGVKFHGHDDASVITQAMGIRMDAPGYHSTSDFPALLGDVMHKQLAALYAAAEPGIAVVAETSTMPDFRAKKIVKLSSFPAFTSIPEGDEFEWGTLQESAEQIAVAVYGKAISVTLQALVNDSLDGINRSLRDVAFAAQQMKAGLILTAFTSANLGDGHPIFYASRGNILDGTDGGPPSLATIGAMRKVLRLAKALDNTTPLGLAVDTLIVPAALETIAEASVSVVQNTVQDGEVQANPFGGKVSVVCEPRLDGSSATEWFGIDSRFKPVQWATLEMTPTPRLEIADGVNANFATLGTSYKAWQAAGAAPTEFRSAVKNSGVYETD